MNLSWFALKLGKSYLRIHY